MSATPGDAPVNNISYLAASPPPSDQPDKDLGSDLDLSDSAFARKCDALIGLNAPTDAELEADEKVLLEPCDSAAQEKQKHALAMAYLRKLTAELEQDEVFNAPASMDNPRDIDALYGPSPDILELLNGGGLSAQPLGAGAVKLDFQFGDHGL
ncbi:hypothetical protein BOTBODRAFT_36722 [Botryobasidium botryosum FD-172 SS1]|uniref:Uncharacterized protein n=1 Tax=Botryobasidium botryosum (strain FD-172 SS1) TaxID=930990 RepID=A0A067MDH5_BOTB1|nr:hypothetical protein BOTBODRAFT_36722 [Botryobasidium botryosum FD-172 SS1]